MGKGLYHFMSNNENLDIIVKIKKVSDKIGSEIRDPFYATPGSAGFDLSACIDQPIMLKNGERVSIPTGIAMQMPSKYIVGLVFPRSGLGGKHGITLANCVGVIDSDYRGEIICPVQNNSGKDYEIQPGQRIAQMVFMPIARADFQFVDELEPSNRGDGGFGSTGS